ncbi:MAG: LytTR family DNA-binding domain-containing protein [Prolixibacteraceae bacterium]|nr:LytTR family DNA-binding domain-containing protein [Prolixibacteraceae bacterium]
MAKDKIRAVIVDDEKKSILTLEKLLEKYCPQVEISGTAMNVDQAVKLIDDLEPELLFLDITMPDGDGFDVIQRVDHRSFEVIFITASNQYAIEAFEFSALHYLLKPINYKELIAAVERFEKLRKGGMLHEQVDVLRQSLNNKHEKIILPTAEGLNIIELDRIIRCEADGNYTHFFLKDKKRMIVSKTLNNFDKFLSGLHFFRVHNKHLINMKYIRRYVRGKAGIVIMEDGSQVDVSESRKKDFLKKLKEYASEISNM